MRCFIIVDRKAAALFINTGHCCCFISEAPGRLFRHPICCCPEICPSYCSLSPSLSSLSSIVAMSATLLRQTYTNQIIVLLLTLSLTVSSQSSCRSEQPQPLLVSIRNVTLANQVLRRGVALSFGTPPQDLAFNIVSYVHYHLLLGTQDH